MQTLVQYGGSGMYNFGQSLAMSEDGSVLVVGHPGSDLGSSGAVYIYRFVQSTSTFGMEWYNYGSGYTSLGVQVLNYGAKVWVSGDGDIVAAAQRYGIVTLYKRNILSEWVRLQEISNIQFSYYVVGGLSGSYDGKVVAIGTPLEMVSGPVYVYAASPVDGQYMLVNKLYPGSDYPGTYPLVARDGDTIFAFPSNGSMGTEFTSTLSPGPWETDSTVFDGWQYITLVDSDDGLLDYRNVILEQKNVYLQESNYQLLTGAWPVEWTCNHPSTEITFYLFYPSLDLTNLTRSSSAGYNIIVPSGYSWVSLFSPPSNESERLFVPLDIPSIYANMEYSLCAIVEGDQYFVRGACISPLLFYCPAYYYGSRCEIQVYDNVTITSTSLDSTGILYEGNNFILTASYSVGAPNDTIQMRLDQITGGSASFNSSEIFGYNGVVTLNTALTSDMVLSNSLSSTSSNFLVVTDSYFQYSSAKNVSVRLKSIDDVTWDSGTAACKFGSACSFTWSSAHPSVTADVYLTLAGSTLSRTAQGALSSSSGILLTVMTGQAPGTLSFVPSSISGVTAAPSTAGTYVLYVVVAGDTVSVRAKSAPTLTITCPSFYFGATCGTKQNVTNRYVLETNCY